MSHQTFYIKFFIASILLVSLGTACSASDDPGPLAGQPVPTATATEVSASNVVPTASDSPDPTATPLPVFDVAALDLKGKLIVSLGKPGLISVDLSTGMSQLAFEPPDNGLVISGSVSAERSLLMLAYAPPPPGDEIQFGYTDLYTLPADGTGPPELFLEATEEGEILFSPVWSPDGQYVYYGRITSTGDSLRDTRTTLERVEYPDGTPEILLEDATWPAVSPDGSQIVYVKANREQASEELFIADADGSNPRLLVTGETFAALDATRFAPDGQSVLFSAVVRETSSDETVPGWLGGLLGAQTAYAHEVPSDLYLIPVEGGTPERLTSLNGINLSPVYSEDGQSIAFSSMDDLQVLDLRDGSVHLLVRKTGLTLFGWIP